MGDIVGRTPGQGVSARRKVAGLALVCQDKVNTRSVYHM